jgi:hypothetical protein
MFVRLFSSARCTRQKFPRKHSYFENARTPHLLYIVSALRQPGDANAWLLCFSAFCRYFDIGTDVYTLPEEVIHDCRPDTLFYFTLGGFRWVDLSMITIIRCILYFWKIDDSLLFAIY